MSSQPHTDAHHIAHRLRDGAMRAVFRALVYDRDDEAHEALARALGPWTRALDLGEPSLREALLDALEYRISPPDEEDTGPVRDAADATMAFLLAA